MITNYGTAKAGTLALDYVNYHDYNAMKANGVSCVLRYLANTGPMNKRLTATERDELHGNGIGILGNLERSSTSVLNGSLQGTIDGVLARDSADAIGYPDGLPIHMSADTAITPKNYQAVRDYIEAFRAAIAPRWTLGVYGGSYIIARCLDIGECFHLSNAHSWSPFPHPWPAFNLPINFVQYYNVNYQKVRQKGLTYDVNDVVRDTPMWLPSILPASPIPDPIQPKSKDDPMFIYAINGYANTFTSTGVHLSPEAFQAMTEAGVPVIHSEYHEEHVESLLHLSGLTKANLVKLA